MCAVQTRLSCGGGPAAVLSGSNLKEAMGISAGILLVSRRFGRECLVVRVKSQGIGKGDGMMV
jgi:hypothetical protein